MQAKIAVFKNKMNDELHADKTVGLVQTKMAVIKNKHYWNKILKFMLLNKIT